MPYSLYGTPFWYIYVKAKFLDWYYDGKKKVIMKFMQCFAIWNFNL